MGLKELMERRGLNQTRVAELTGIPRVNINKYANGKKDIHLMSLDNALKLCDVLNCTPQELLDD